MINIILEPIKTAIATLDIIERLSGVVIPMNVPKIQKGQRVGTNTFPIAQDAQGLQCYETGQYNDMLPNTKYKSVLYFEQRNDLSFTGFTNVYDDLQLFECDIRLVFWLNHKKLGYTDTNLTDRAVLTILKAINDNSESGEFDRDARRLNVTNANYTGAIVEIQTLRQVNRSRGIFSNYSIEPELLLPFDYGAIDFHCWLQVGKECFTPLAAQSEIEC